MDSPRRGTRPSLPMTQIRPIGADFARGNPPPNLRKRRRRGYTGPQYKFRTRVMPAGCGICVSANGSQ